MRHTILSKIVPALILVVFIIIMNSGTIFKKILGISDNIPEYIGIMQVSINNKNWMEAIHYLKKLKADWNRSIPKIQYSVERDEINNLQHSLARLEGFLTAKEKAGSLAELSELKETWYDLGK